jgi:hypothetical protein
MTVENERAEPLFEDDFARFKQSYVDLIRTTGTTRLSFSDPPVVLSEPPKDILVSSANPARLPAPPKRRFRKSRSLLRLVASTGR